GESQPSAGVAVTPGAVGAEGMAALLRAGEPAVVARIAEGRLVCDLRTVLVEEEEALCRRLVDSQ
ncbi:MAG: L-seryl-tRNA(Sec) selenium transferase, partial [Chloroflexales bacterium]|nr:L-seryl-tRNA(Sec) selenium transferase [Chloroflexales bacterium]